MPVDPAALAAVRRWLRGLATEHAELCYNAFYQALSASFLRISRFGVEAGAAAYRARELMHFTLMCDDERNSEWLRHAYSRAVLEDDREIIALFVPLPLATEFQAWFHALDGADETAAGAALAEPSEDAEELAMRRLVIARRHPGLIDASWLHAENEVAERITHALLRTIVARRRDLHDAALTFLAGTPRCLVAGEPDDLLAPLVEASQRPPQHLLSRFAEWYGERTVLAAATWHLEHTEPSAALALAAPFRSLSRHAEHAWLVAALSCLELHRIDDAVAWRDRIDDPALRAQVEIALLERDPRESAAAGAADIADACAADQPELFYRCVRLLLARSDLVRARGVCTRRRDDFLSHPVVAAMIDEILRPRAAVVTPPTR